MQNSLSLSFLAASLTAFWLIIVSTIIDVFPVWRSPMISSRCPRPIGISESMIFKPVCTGSCTLRRSIMPGARVSTLANSLALTAPSPSIGCPSASTTRPSSSFPTGTLTILFVRLTVSPSLISASEPKITTPTLSSPRFSAIPLTPDENSTISLYSTPVSP